MPKTVAYNLEWFRDGSIYNASVDQNRFYILENLLSGIYNYVGEGVIDGWDVITWVEFSEKDEEKIIEKHLELLTQEEINNLSNATKNSLLHLDYKMIVKIDEGDGIVDQYAAFTTSNYYIALPKNARNETYYIWAVPTEALPEPLKHKAKIIANTNSSYDETNIAVYLAEVSVVYDSVTKIQSITAVDVETGRRRELYQFEGIVVDEIRDEFIRHLHNGKDISKINLTTENSVLPKQRDATIKSPIYLTDTISIDKSYTNGPEILSITIDDSQSSTLLTGKWYYAVTFVTSVNGIEKESFIGEISSIDVTLGQTVKIKWDKILGCKYYNIYRTQYANDSGKTLYLLQEKIFEYQFNDTGIDLIDPLTLPPVEVSTEVTTSSGGPTTTTSYSPGDSLYMLDSSGEYYQDNFTIPGILETNLAFGASQSNFITTEDQKYYRAKIKLNGEYLDPDDYRIVLSDNTTNSGIVELKNNLRSTDKLEIVLDIDPEQTQVTGTLSSSRIGEINASSFKYGTIPSRFMTPPNHYGLERIKESTILKPYINLRSNNYKNYYILDPSGQVQYDDEILFIGNAYNAHRSLGKRIDSVQENFGDSGSDFITERIALSDDVELDTGGKSKFIVGTRHGNYITEDFQYFDLIENLPVDNGIVIDCYDNFVLGRNGGENFFFETFVLLNTGKIFYSNNNYQDWEEITYPRDDIFLTAFCASTERIDTDNRPKNPSVKSTYNRKIYIGGYTTDTPIKRGVWVGTGAETETVHDLTWEFKTIFNTYPSNIYCITELITETRTSVEGLELKTYPRTLYTGTNNGLYVNWVKKQTYVEETPVDIYPKYIYWILKEHIHPDDVDNLTTSKQYGCLNDIMLVTDEKLYMSHGAKYKTTANSQYWIHPLTYKIDRPYEIAVDTDLLSTEMNTTNETNKYLLVGTDTNAWYAYERRSGLSGNYNNLPVNLFVSGNNSTGCIYIELLVEGTHSENNLTISLDVVADAFADDVIIKPDDEYAAYFGWRIPEWEKIKFSEYCDNINCFINVDQNIPSIGPPQKDAGIGRTGPFVDKTEIQLEEDKYINFEYVTNESIITITFETEVEINATNLTRLNTTTDAFIANHGDKGIGLFEINDKILWVSTESFRLTAIKNNDVYSEIQLTEYETTKLAPVSQEKDDTIFGNSVVAGETSEDQVEIDIFDEVTYGIGTNIVMSSNNGLWKCIVDVDPNIDRLYYVWNNNINPNIYVNDELMSEITYTTNSLKQSVDFYEELRFDDVIKIEKDFREYFLTKGYWEQSGADIIVYIDNVPTKMQWTPYPSDGMIRFSQSLTKNNNIEVSLIKPGAYLSNIGTIPHSEVNSAYVINENYSSTLSKDLKPSDKIVYIKAADFPLNTQFISINGELIHVQVRDYSTKNGMVNSFDITYQRTSTSTYLAKITNVYKTDVKNLLGIEDYLSMNTTSGTTFTFSNLFYSNFQKIVGTLRHTYTNITGDEDLISEDLLTTSTVHEGFRNSYYHDFSFDSFDTINTFNTYYDGNNISTIPPKVNVIYCSYEEIDFNSEGSLVGTDKGIFIKTGNNWKQVNTCNNCSKVYFIKKFRGDIWAGTDTGIWISTDDGNTWLENTTYYQQVFNINSGDIEYNGFKANVESFDENISTESIKYYEAFMKDDGLTFVLYKNQDDGTGDFWSDHVRGIDNYDSYYLDHHKYIEYSGGDIKERKDALFIGSSYGIWTVYNAQPTLNSEYSDFLTDRRLVSSQTTFISDKIDEDGNYITEQIRYFNFFINPLDPVELVFLTNNGIKISRDWEFVSAENNLTWKYETLNNYTCYCSIYINDTNYDSDHPYYNRFYIGTDKGIVSSFDGRNWFPIFYEKCTVYNLLFNDSKLYAFTSSGIYESDDYGDNWIQTDIEIGHYKNLSVYLAQVFTPEAIETSKISVYFTKRAHYTEETTGTISLSIYTTDNGIPDTLVTTSTTTYNFTDIKESRWYTFELETSLDTEEEYAIVLEQTISEEKAIGWGYTYDATNAFIYDDEWLEEEYGFHYLIHYNYDPQIEIVEFEAEYKQENSNNLAATTLNTLLFDPRFIFSFIIDGTGTMLWQDTDGPANDIDGIYNKDYRKTKIYELIEMLLARSDWSYIDLWHYDTKLRHSLINGMTRDLSEISDAFSRISSEGSDSEVYDGSSLGFGNMFYNGINDALSYYEDYDFAIEYMESMKRIDHDALQEINPNYDKNVQSLFKTEFAELKQIVIDDFIYSYGRIGFIASDGFDNQNGYWRDVPLTINSLKREEDCPLYIFGLGKCNDQTPMIEAAKETNGKYFYIGNNLDQWDDIIDELLNGDYYIWQGTYQEIIDLGSVQYLEYIECPATIPLTSDVILEYRYTKDQRNWSNWQTLLINERNSIKLFVSMFEFKITIKQGDLISGDPIEPDEYYDYGYDYALNDVYPSPIVGSLKYGIVTPSISKYITEIFEDGPIFEYSFVYSGTKPETCILNWKLSRGDSINTDNYISLRQDQRGMLSNRQYSVSYLPEISSTYNTINFDSRIQWAVIDSQNQLMTWLSTDTTELYINNTIVNKEEQNYRIAPANGLIEFDSALKETDVLTVKIITMPSVSVINGEDTVRANNYTFYAINGPWVYDSEVIVYRNNNRIFDGYDLYPEDGKIIFNNYVLEEEEINILICPSINNRICLEVVNYSDIQPDLENFSLMYSTTSNNPELSYLDDTTQPTVEDLYLTTTDFTSSENPKNNNIVSQKYIGHKYSVPNVSYEYKHSNNLNESGTEIKWLRKRIGETEFTEEESYNGKISKNVNDEIADYNIESSEIWTEGDTWKIEVIPATPNVRGNKYYSNEFVIGTKEIIDSTASINYHSHYPPNIYNIKIVKSTGAINSSDPTNEDYCTELTKVNNTVGYYYENEIDEIFYVKFSIAAETDTEDIVINNSIIKWYNNNSETAVYDSSQNKLPRNGDYGKWVVPQVKHHDSWYCEIIPYDIINYGIKRLSYRIELSTGEN
jgi:hypothetical protein